MTPTELPLLNECIGAGGTVSLFPILSGWPADKLRQLLVEIDTLWDGAEKAYAADVVRPENFFSPKASADLDATRFNLLAMLSEISSVALLYLGDNAAPADASPHPAGSPAAGAGGAGKGRAGVGTATQSSSVSEVRVDPSRYTGSPHSTTKYAQPVHNPSQGMPEIVGEKSGTENEGREVQ